MIIQKNKELSIYRVLLVFVFGLISGIQLALYMYDYYDDGVADIKLLWIGVALAVFSLGFLLYSFRLNDSNTHINGD